MKIAVYTCALNEQHNLERWYNSAQDADQVLVLDTGSEDHSLPLLATIANNCQNLIIYQAHIHPWRFDDAKNMALHHLDPDIDIAIQLDADEILTQDWRTAVEDAWHPGTTRLRYRYVWSWLRPGHPDKLFYADKISGRHTHRWKHPVHEVLTPTAPEITSTLDHLLIEHHPDQSKDRSNYLPLLQLSTQEDPHNDRNAHYYARELYFHQKYPEAIAEFKRHLALPTATWPQERANSLRILSKCYEAQNCTDETYGALLLATLQDPSSREPFVDLAAFLLRQQEWCGCIHFAMKASNIANDKPTYISERYAREEGPADLCAVALYHLGQRSAAIAFAKQALAFNPQDQRLQDNLRMMQQ